MNFRCRINTFRPVKFRLKEGEKEVVALFFDLKFYLQARKVCLSEWKIFSRALSKLDEISIHSGMKNIIFYTNVFNSFSVCVTIYASLFRFNLIIVMIVL